MHTPAATPAGYLFRYRVYMWLVDLDQPPRLPRLFAAAGPHPQPRSPGRPRPLDPRQPGRLPARQRGRARRRPGAAADQRAGAGPRLQPALGVLVPRRRRHPSLRRRRGAQHPRRTALLPARAGRARPRRDRQSLLRVALPDRGRPLPDVPRHARRAALNPDGAGPERTARVPGIADGPSAADDGRQPSRDGCPPPADDGPGECADSLPGREAVAARCAARSPSATLAQEWVG